MRTAFIVLIVVIVSLIVLPGLWALYGLMKMIDEWDSWANLRSKIKGPAIAKGAFKYPAFKLGMIGEYLDANTDFIEAEKEEVAWE